MGKSIRPLFGPAELASIADLLGPSDIKRWVDETTGSPGLSGSRFRAAARAIRWKLGIVFGAKRARVDVGPAKFYCYPGVGSASGIACYGFLEWDETVFAVRFLRSGDLFLDIGANIGVYSVLAGTYLPDVSVISLEPDEDARGMLIENLELNGRSTEDVVAKVVGDSVGSIRFSRGLDLRNGVAQEGSTDFVELEQTTVDELVGDRDVQLMKVDVEGFELSVFKGAVKQLAKRPGPVILFELNGHCLEYGVEPAEIIDFLTEAGYRVFEYDGVANELNEYTGRGIPPSHNLVATTDPAPVLERLRSATPPVDLFDLPITLKLQR